MEAVERFGVCRIIPLGFHQFFFFFTNCVGVFVLKFRLFYQFSSSAVIEQVTLTCYFGFTG